ncbi:YraN family protein [Aridibaculum aurantiacum]|uniref:YraN family protein n=1 Tax=Aridibaculum aurantiacum TaxID=2810307 RepID=UPI001A9703E2|nr:YraN family protein [Aridibaculum aurantiacum]
MADHNDTGIEGEKLAAEWLTAKGFLIRETNWRFRHWEVDLIAEKGDTLHFIEVKTRRSTRYGNPEDSITRQKFKNLKDAAEQYQFLNPGWKWIQFDVLAILVKGEQIDYWFNQDVYL